MIVMMFKRPPGKTLRYLLLALLLPLSFSVSALDVDVVALKAAYLANFMKFVKWLPENNHGNQTSEICLLAESGELQDALVSIANSAGAPGRFSVRRLGSDALESPESTRACAVLYFEEEYRDAIADQIKLMLESPILLVSENDVGSTFSMISMFLVGNKLKFSVNLRLVSDAQLSISSKLLRLAYRVYE